jgi:DNA-binding response OmpR family regulator
MVPRVIMVRRDRELDEPDLDEPDVDEVEPAIAPDGEAALAMLRREHFDAVLVDLALAPLDGWCVLAAVGSRAERPRLVAIVADCADIPRARILGADLCVAAGTQLHARALVRSTKEMTCPRPLTTNSPRTTRTGVST